MGRSEASPLRPKARLATVAVLTVLLTATLLTGQPGPAGPQIGRRGAGPVGTRERPSVADPHYCDGCSPPLVYSGGPVMATNSGRGITITPIYWQPAGAPFTFPVRYRQILNGFVHNLAAASGRATNFDSVATEYYEQVDGATIYVTYHVTAGPPIVDTTPFPGGMCAPVQGEKACLTDQQLRDELARLVGASRLPADLAHFYPVFLPPGVQSDDRDGSNSVSDFCGYHRGFRWGLGEIVYASLPYEASGCDSGESPNGNLAADAEVSTLAHEISEAMTDPDDQTTGWNDSSGNEMADICADSYGTPLGSTNKVRRQTTEYNQVINGGKYYIQEMFSNLAYASFGKGHGCVQSEALAQHPASPLGRVVDSIYSEATPTRLPADGIARSFIDVSVGDNTGGAVAGDRVTFGIRTRSGKGRCGRLDRASARTGSSGDATVSYTASSADVECEITAVEARGGLSASSVIYQGATSERAPTITASFPAALRAGGPPVIFTISASNPSDEPVPAAQIVVAFFQGAPKSAAVRARQIHLAYSSDGPTGPFTPVGLVGTTATGNDIEGYVGPEGGSTLVQHSSRTYSFRLSVAPTVPSEPGGQPLLDVEAYLDQVDSGSGSGTTLDDSYSFHLHVHHR